MRRYVTVLSSVAVLCSCTATAYGQDDPRVGLTIGYPGAVGVLWRATDRVAIRPEVTASRGSTDSSSIDPITGTTGTVTELGNWQVGVGLSGLFYLTRDDGFRTYVTPRVAYTKMSASSEPVGTVSTSSEGRAYATSASFGAQYSFASRFGVFGEAGVNYTSTTTHSSTVQSITNIGIGAGGLVTSVSNVTFGSEVHSHSTSLRGGVGVIVYF